MRILSVDYGKKRTGLAVTDPLKLIANGLVTVNTSELLDYIVAYVQKEEVETIVFGEPKQPNGQPSENLQRVKSFAGRLKQKLAEMFAGGSLKHEIKIDWYDERFTSVLAHQTMLQSGIGKKARQNKALVDEISATIILQDYMQFQARY